MKTVKPLHHLNAWEQSTAPASSLVTATGIPVLDDLLPGGRCFYHGGLDFIQARENIFCL